MDGKYWNVLYDRKLWRIKMKKTNTAQENDNRSRNNPKNSAIYQRFTEQELSQLTDKEFEILQTKIRPIYGPGTSAFFHDFSTGPEAAGLNGDGTALNIYKRLMAAHQAYHPCFEKYSRVFSFCRALGVTDIYDIGCGNQLQAFLLVYAPDMNYTGIDDDIFHDYPDDFAAEPEYVNELFEKFTGGGQIRYIKKTYPFDLAAAENNIAVILDCGFGNDENKKNAAAFLSRDFERVLLNFPHMEYNLTGMDIRDIICGEVEVWANPFEKYYALWKKAMLDFEFYRIGEPNYIFGTRIPKDRAKLEKSYTLTGNRVMAGVIDSSWHLDLRRRL
jgi:hypothetical protein